MKFRTIAAGAAVALALGIGGVFVLYLQFPVERAVAQATPVTAAEMAETIAALKPAKRARPVVAVIGANEGSETTDYLIPFGVLKRSGVADVVALGMHEGPVTLMPALTIVPDMTAAAFDLRYADGADYVIVPALHNASDPAVHLWLQSQRAKGATIVGICAGALVLAEAGLLHQRRATTHWHWISTLVQTDPTITYVPNRRYVADRGVVTTTGVSASLPVSLAIVEAIAGHERALAVAAEVGLPGWDAAHASGAFRLTRGDVRTYLASVSGLRPRETVGVPLEAGMDEVALALVADAYENSFAARIVSLGDGPVVSAQGLRFVPDGRGTAVDRVVPLTAAKPAAAFDQTLGDIAGRYGEANAVFARLSLEYPAN